MKLQLFKFGEHYKRFLQLRRFYWLSWLRSFGLRRSALSGSLRFGLDALDALRRSRASLWSMLFFLMLLLAYFFGVRDVSWVSHYLFDGSQRLVGRMSQCDCSPCSKINRPHGACTIPRTRRLDPLICLPGQVYPPTGREDPTRIY